MIYEMNHLMCHTLADNDAEEFRLIIHYSGFITAISITIDEIKKSIPKFF